jgi:hypothetical protein
MRRKKGIYQKGRFFVSRLGLLIVIIRVLTALFVAHFNKIRILMQLNRTVIVK